MLVVAITLSSCAPNSSANATPGNPPPSSSTSPTNAPTQAAGKDPYYTYFSDPSITKPPVKDALFGNGQTITIEYDRSKSQPSDPVFYQLFYVDPEGSVRPITGSPFEEKTSGVFTTSNKVYSSEANGRPGFMEVIIVQNAKVVGGDQGVTGKSVRLGMYPIQLQVSP